MAHAVWKYPIPVDDRFELAMPAGADVLCVQTQGGEPRLWALVDPSAEKQTRGFLVVPTGTIVEGVTASSYLGTVQFFNGELVFHVFAETV